MHTVLKLFLAITLLLLTVLLAWLTMEDHLSLGAGEKDIFLAVPLLLWSLVHLCCYLVLWRWRRSFSTGRLLAVSASVATGATGVALAVVFGISWLRFR